MTVNERLFTCGLMGAYDRAVAAGDEGEMTRILEKVYLTPEDIQRSLDDHRRKRTSP